MKSVTNVLLAIIAIALVYLAFSHYTAQRELSHAIDQAALREKQSIVMGGISYSVVGRRALDDYFYQHGNFPVSFADADLRIWELRRPIGVLGMEIEDNGIIAVKYEASLLGLFSLNEAHLYWVPTIGADNRISWSCVPSREFGEIAMKLEYIPEPCFPQSP